MQEAGLRGPAGETPDRARACCSTPSWPRTFARDLLQEGIYVVGFSHPVVPMGKARIRTQLSADHDIPMLRKALVAFKKVGEKYGILGLDKKGIIAKYGN